VITNETAAAAISNLLLQVCEALNESVIVAREHCPTDEFRLYRRAVGAVLAEINDRLLNPLYSDHPALEPESQKRVRVRRTDDARCCRDAKERCIGKCSNLLPLPSTDHGATFDRCVNASMEDPGCL
jgi:hypothetical protein